MTYALDFVVNLGKNDTGLTLEAQLKDSAGVNVGAAITAGFTEIGRGVYLFSATAIPDAHRGMFVFQISVGGAVQVGVAVNPQTAENVDAKVTTRATPAQVNAQVVDVMTVDVIPELAVAAPAATPTIVKALMLLYMQLRNESDLTAALARIKNDAGTPIASSALSDDGTTFTRAELA